MSMLLPYNAWYMLMVMSVTLGMISGATGGLMFAMLARQPIIPEYFEVHLACIFAVGLGGLVYVLGGVDAACATLKATLVCVSDTGQESKTAKPESSKPTAGQESEPESSQSKAGKDDCVSPDSLRRRPGAGPGDRDHRRGVAHDCCGQ